MEKGKDFIPHPNFVSYIDRLVKLFLRKYSLENWEIRVRYVEKIPGMKGGYSAEIEDDYTYFLAKVRISRKLYKSWQEGHYRRVANVIAHELAHIITGEIRNLANEWAHTDDDQGTVSLLDENATERIAGAILKTIDDYQDEPEYLPRFNEKSIGYQTI